MAVIGSITGPSNVIAPVRLDEIQRPVHAPAGKPAGAGFGEMLEGFVQDVSDKQTEAADITKKVLTGESGQLHQSVIAMQEASVAFGLMVEVRNKLVESYQELMRMQV